MTAQRAPSRILPRAFPGIKPDEIEELIAHSSVHTYEPGTVLCREDEVEDRFYMILEGEAEVIEQPHGSLDVASEPGKGSTFTINLKNWT